MRPNEGIALPSTCNKQWTNFDKTMSNENVLVPVCEGKIAATFELKTFKILKLYGFKFKYCIFFFYLNFHITITGLKKISLFFLSFKVMKTKRETLELNIIGGQIST